MPADDLHPFWVHDYKIPRFIRVWLTGIRHRIAYYEEGAVVVTKCNLRVATVGDPNAPANAPKSDCDCVSDNSTETVK